MAKVVLLSGNTQRPSKSRALAAFIGRSLARHADVELLSLDLLDAGRSLGGAYTRDELSTEARAVVEAIENADAIVVTTPVYKGSYPGLFKHLIDFVDPRALAGKPVLLSATGGSQRHSLVVEHQLRPLFGFFSAQISAYAIFAVDDEFVNYVPVADKLRERIERATMLFGEAF
ncbi:hypothetical protein WH87_12770 [Devosia epidermidihirudinis]|uniref:NADPH-dependent FMN reductase-like domain-containing protein n=1 Tax=Devosia epidermidihirudinis TaxID=1293439 RepID=A0A0F5Q9T1_9HYPH|nr:NAD(P)H-dependent oxidoreductase [Devosia epidermidihirudinis]KKC37491.1 hypothetical protein WH87_12770 [Devosia epidermidihirudinis]